MRGAFTINSLQTLGVNLGIIVSNHQEELRERYPSIEFTTIYTEFVLITPDQKFYYKVGAANIVLS